MLKFLFIWLLLSVYNLKFSFHQTYLASILESAIFSIHRLNTKVSLTFMVSFEILNYMLEKISAEAQLILIIFAIAILFVLVLLNNKRNRKKQFEREGRNFRSNFYNKRKGRKSKK